MTTKVYENILGRIGKNGYFCEKLDNMAVELQQTVSRIAAKSRINRMRAENERLRSQVDYLKMAAIVAPEREDVERTRALLSNLVREIDKCIADLND